MDEKENEVEPSTTLLSNEVLVLHTMHFSDASSVASSQAETTGIFHGSSLV